MTQILFFKRSNTYVDYEYDWTLLQMIYSLAVQSFVMWAVAIKSCKRETEHGQQRVDSFEVGGTNQDVVRHCKSSHFSNSSFGSMISSLLSAVPVQTTPTVFRSIQELVTESYWLQDFLLCRLTKDLARRAQCEKTFTGRFVSWANSGTQTSRQ